MHRFARPGVRRVVGRPAATRRLAACVLAGGLLLASACSSQPHAVVAAASGAAPVGTTPSRSAVSSTSTVPTSGAATSGASTTGAATSSAPGPAAQLPRGGTRIIGHYRVVAFYGAPGTASLGVLGQGTPEQAAQGVTRMARGFAGYGLPVQPAMELIATVAQGSPGPDGDYSAPVPDAEIQRYLDVAHEHRMLLVLDLQPGRASFLSQAKHLRRFLLDPSVGLGLDPEWKVSSGAPGGGRIGSSTAAGVNAVVRYVSGLVRSHDLPDKLVVVHQFTDSMLPDRDAIDRRPGAEVTFHADGFGSRAVKRNVFHELDFPGHPFGTGFKLFLTQDTHLMRPAQVMKLSPRPDVITYQ